MKEKDKRDLQIPLFSGADYNPKLDKSRLISQIDCIFSLMIDGKWRSLEMIGLITGYPQASISAQLRNLRKEKFGSYIVERRRATFGSGLFEYSVKNPTE